MWRALIYIAVLCLAALGAVWISDLPGDVTITMLGRTASPSLPVVVALLLAAGLILALVWWLVGFLLRLPLRIGRASRTRRRAKGYQALSRGMIAVGAGDTGQARRHAKDAQRLLGEEPLTLLLNAQVAQVTGDLANADAAFRKMTANQETRLLGLRGLFIEARRQGDQQGAYRHAYEAAQLAPAAGWANEAVLEAQCMQGAWTDALEMIDKRAAFGLIDKPTAKRQRAVLLTANALAREEAQPEQALHDVTRALKYDPALVPAAVLAGRLLGRRNEVRKAAKVLEKAWSATPHPDLADAYIHLRAGDSAQDRLKRAETLGKLANWQPEARLVIARAALDAREFKRARDVLEPLLKDRPTIRTCLLMADIEEAEHGAVGHVREWVSRAARAPRDPAWIADGVVSDHWAPFSPVSGHIDAFRWQTPPDTLVLPATPEFDLDIAPEGHADKDAPLIAAKTIDVTPEAEQPATPLAEPAPPPSAAPEAKAAATTEAASKTEATPITETVPPADATPAGAPRPDSTETTLPVQAAEPVDAPPPDAPESPAGSHTESGGEEPAESPTKAAKGKTAAPTPQPVVFPIQRAPDDPGIDEDEKTARKR